MPRQESHYYAIRRAARGGGFLVCDLDGRKVAGPFGYRAGAERHRDTLEARANASERRCLRCGATFLSAGAGNRMCPHCRQLSQPSRQFEGW